MNSVFEVFQATAARRPDAPFLCVPARAQRDYCPEGAEFSYQWMLDQALAAGAKGLKAPEPVFWGGYSGYFADLDGHVWELAHNPGAIIDADGSTRFLGEDQNTD